MQGERTPTKQAKNENDLCAPDFTSGKQLRRVNIGVFSANRNDRPQIHRFSQFINIMADQNSPPQQENPEAVGDAIKQEQEQIDRKCALKLQQRCQQETSSSAAKQRIGDLLAYLKELRFGRQRKKYESMALKKENLKANRKLELEKEDTHSRVEEMRMMVRKQEQSMYEGNRLIYDKQKEKLQLAEEVNQIAAKNREVIELIMVNGMKLEELMAHQREIDTDYEFKRARYEEQSKIVNEHILQLGVLKMQVNPFMRVHFESLNSSLSTKKRILDKNPNLWQKKNKLFLKDEIKHFVLLQLYPSWRRLLDRLSYHFIGYRQLLFEHSQNNFDSTLEDLDEYIFSNGKQIRYKSSIVVYSPQGDTYTGMKESLMQLTGLNNGLLEVMDVTFQGTEKENIEQVLINYLFKGEKKVKKFEMVSLKQLTREALLPYYIPAGIQKSEKTSLIKIEIPFSFSTPSDRMRMEDAYRLIEREK